MAFRWPTTQHRTLILGSTGSGKSQLGAHVLSNAPITRMPYFVLDYKRDPLINSIPHSHVIGPDEIPKEPGVYVVHLTIDDDDERVEMFLQRLHKRGRAGLFLDEGFMVPHRRPFRALNAIYTQGRSMHIPVITLTQRPAYISRYAYSEADHIIYLRLNDRRDRKTVAEFVPGDDPIWDLRRHPAKYHAKWYDVGLDETHIVLPAPKADDILEAFERRLKTNRKVHW